MKKIYLLLAAITFAQITHAQLHLDAIGVPAIENFTGITGVGFQPGGGDGTINSKNWSATGFSDGAVDFGGTALSGDFARGTTMGLETTGGIYAVDILGNQGLMVQPVDADFTPGSFILMLENSTGTDVGSIDVSYMIYVLNDQNRSNSFNLSFSYDNVSYTDIPDVNYTSPEVGDFSPYTELKSTTISGLTIPNGSVFYLRWTGDDVGGSGSRDEFALDDVSVTGNEAVITPLITLSPTDITVSETGTANFVLESTESTDCTMYVMLGVGTATEGVDFEYDIPSPLIFLEGEASTAFLSIDIIDDAIDEDDEIIYVSIEEVVGTCALGLPNSVAITITDDDAPPPPVYTVYDIIEVSNEDFDGTSLEEGLLVDLTGIVYGVNLWDGGLQFTLIDETGGISVFNFDYDFGYSVTEGDEVNVKGTIDQFNGLTEIVADTLIFISSDNTLKTAMGIISLNEGSESDLVALTASLNYVDIGQWLGDGTSFNVDLTDGINTYIMRIDDNTELASMPAPSAGAPYHLNVMGIGGQYDADVPYTEGYELFPRYATDIEVIVIPESIEELGADLFAVYPNPVTDQLVCSGKENIEWVEIMNQLGETVQMITVNHFETSVDVRLLPAGLYFLKIKTETGVYSSNFIKQ